MYENLSKGQSNLNRLIPELFILGLTFANCKMICSAQVIPSTIDLVTTVYRSTATLSYSTSTSSKHYQQTRTSSPTRTSNYLTTLTVSIHKQWTKVLANYFKYAATHNNTLTIVLSYHGNSYTSYSLNELEGRYEMHHPVLFMIVPKQVRSAIGKQKPKAMRSNQKRLMNMVDIQNVDPSSPMKGFLQTIDPYRTCKHLNLSMPNLCVCEGSETPLQNDTDLIGQLEFSIGHLNRMINMESSTS